VEGKLRTTAAVSTTGYFTESQDECNGACREPEVIHTVECRFRRVMDTSAVIQTQTKAVGTPELTLRNMRGFATDTDTDAGKLSPTVYDLCSIVREIKPF
jgi:hypothetical protein